MKDTAFKLSDLRELFFVFFKIGAVTFGGGYAMLPMLEQELAEKRSWTTKETMLDYYAIGQSTPGIIAVNVATFIGFHKAGVLGALVATAGIVTPSIIIIIVIAYFLEKFRTNRYVDAAFYGLRPASVGLIGAAGINIVLLSFFRVSSLSQLAAGFHFDYRHILLAAAVLVLTRYVKPTKKLHPIYFILMSAVIGIVFGFAQ